ncbi:lipocalin-like domain-containing protein [Sinomicrobium oceani]|uniref:lipocalin-like domain-containing protein n=1 Tax=Sinomicrobium oceani TaxID=1150368 RepID=UPI00227B29B7|nr:lipocalin-like domain-containing protein [Sinomicrobium oceani]
MKQMKIYGMIAIMALNACTTMENNRIKGAWELVSGNLHLENDTLPLFGKKPSGSLIFTENMRFNVILNDMDVPAFHTEDRSQGTCEELRAAVTGSLALYGTYAVDGNGDFESQHVIGSTFPNWNGLDRDNGQLSLERKGNLLVENLPLENGGMVVIEWRKISDR